MTPNYIFKYLKHNIWPMWKSSTRKHNSPSPNDDFVQHIKLDQNVISADL